MANGNFGGGNGSLENPYIVQDAVDFARISDNRGAFYKQDRNIDFSSVTSWTNIGSSSTPFTGSYDGDNYSMTNISLQDNNSIFGYCINANIVNLKIFGTLVVENTAINAPLATSNNVSSNYTTVTNVHSTFTITRDPSFTSTGVVFQIGGLVSGTRFSLTGCSFSGSITITTGSPNARLSGIVAYGGSQLSPSVSLCSNHGNITGIGYVTGIIDHTASVVKTISNCYNTGNLKGSVVYAISYTGNPTRCYNSGILTASSELRGVGGNNPTNCYNVAPYAQISSGSTPNLNNFYKVGSSSNSTNYVLDTIELRNEG